MSWPFEGLERNGYDAIVADPPWHYKSWSSKGNTRSSEAHYKTMRMDDIIKLPVADLAKDDCHLFLWITGPFLVQGAHVEIFKAWGFNPSSMGFIWLKPKKSLWKSPGLFPNLSEDNFVKGMGRTTRQNAEYVLIGRRGKPPRDNMGMHQLLLEPRREHSRKPASFPGKIETYIGPGKRVVDLFSRTSHPGWDAWGDEVSKFDEVAT